MPRQWEEKLAQTLEMTHPQTEPHAGWEARAVAKMEALRPAARPLWWRRAAVVAAAAALVAVGVLAVPSGSRRARQAWGQAVAGMEAAKALHLAGQVVLDGVSYDFEEWRDREGFYRCELRQDGVLRQLWMTNGLTEEVRPEEADGGGPFRGEGWHQPYYPRLLNVPSFSRRDRPAVMPAHRREVPSTTGLEERLAGWVDGYDGLNRLDLSEHTERTTDGQEQRVLELSGTSPSSIVNRGGKWVSGPEQDTYRLRMTLDPMGQVVGLNEDWLEGDKWVSVYQTSLVEMNAEIAPELRAASEVPPGHLIVRDGWWSRLEQTAATGTSRDWEVTLHAVEVNRDGDLFVTFSRQPRPGSPLPTDTHLMFGLTAVDDTGARYELRLPQDDPRSPDDTDVTRHVFPGSGLGALVEAHLRVRLSRTKGGPAGPAPQALTVTLTMDSPPREQVRQHITFSNLPFPPRQPGGNLWQEQITVEE